ncbi:MAG: hypothetical protein IPF49_00010 [Gammaproteobacteria bacterium]|nr:hypothetical protein [Gammaproteobacteria bacterium]
MRSLTCRADPGRKELFRQEHPPRALHTDIARRASSWSWPGRNSADPALVLLLGDTPAAGKQAEYLQDLHLRTLGIELKLDKQVCPSSGWKKMTAGDFDMVASAWGPDYDDPLTYADLFASWNMNNADAIATRKYDRRVGICAAKRRGTRAQRGICAHPGYRDRGRGDRRALRAAALRVQHPRLGGVKPRVFGGDPKSPTRAIKQ